MAEQVYRGGLTIKHTEQKFSSETKNAFPKGVANALGRRQENPGTRGIGEKRGERGKIQGRPL